jgi:hypothetical protein
MSGTVQSERPAETATPAPLPTETLEDLVLTFVRLADFARREGLLSLEERMGEIDEQEGDILRAGLMEVVDGAPPAVIAEVLQIRINEIGERLEREKQARLARLRLQLTGVLAVQAGDAPRLVRTKLEGYLPPSARTALPPMREILPSLPPAVQAAEVKPLPPLNSPEDFTFEHVRELSDRDVQRVARELDSVEMALALRMATEDARKKILRKGMSRRAAAAIEEQMAIMGPQHVDAARAAQERITEVVRRLHASKEILIPVVGTVV